MRRKNSPAIMAFVRMITSRNPEVLRAVGNKIILYASMIEREAPKEDGTRKRLKPSSIEPLTCLDAMV